MNLSIAMVEIGTPGYQTVTELRELLERVSGKVNNAPENSTFLLFSGKTIDEYLTAGIASELYPPDFQTVSDSDAGKLLAERKFERQLEAAIKKEILDAPFPPNGEALEIAIKQQLAVIRDGRDLQGNRVSTDSLWDIASKKYVQENNGNWRIMAGAEIDPKSVLTTTELPELLKKTGDFLIDGIPRSELNKIKLADPAKTAAAQMQQLLAVATTQTIAGAPRPGNVAAWIAMTPQKAVDVLTSEHAALRATAQKALSRLGIAGDIFGLLFAVKDANAAYAEGNTAKGNAILQDWLADFLGGAMGGLVAGQAAAVLLAGLAVTPAGFIAVGTLTFLFGVLGSVAGSNYAQSILDELRGLFTTAKQTRSPLALDLDGDGVTTLARDASGVHFDHDGNGFAELSGWVSPRDALLVRDLDGNGRIDSGAELFGNHTKLTSGARAANGFTALSDLDLDKNGSVDLTEAERAGLRLWRDLDSDGVTDAGELQSLASAGVSSLSTAFADSTAVDSQGNAHRQVGQFTDSSGRPRAMSDVWFATDPARTVDQAEVVVPAELKSLPDIPGLGNVPSLHQAMARDTSGKLAPLVRQWLAASVPQRRALTPELLYTWAGVADIAPDSRSSVLEGNAIGDARKVATLERLLGEDFIGIWCSGARDANPNAPAAKVLQQAFDRWSSYVDLQLSIGVDAQRLMSRLQAVDRSSMASSAAATLLDWLAERYLVDGKLVDITSVLSIGQSLAQFQPQGAPLMAALQAAARARQDDLGQVVRSLTFTDARSAHRVTSIRLGSDKGDHLYGGLDNDLLMGGPGDDWLQGGDGSDIYEFNLGDGNDTLFDNSYVYRNGSWGQHDLNQVKLGAGLTRAATLIERRGDDLRLSWPSGESLTLQRYYSDGRYQPDIQFADGTSLTTSDVAAVPQDGSDGRDRLIGLDGLSNHLRGLAGDDELIGSDKADHLEGGDGSDALYASSGDDRLYGDAGSDSLRGGSGDDLLVGGSGDDWVQGGDGSDIYEFNLGDGHDTLNDNNRLLDRNLIRLGAGLDADHTALTRLGDDLLISWSDHDSILVQEWFRYEWQRLAIAFSDGQRWEADEVQQRWETAQVAAVPASTMGQVAPAGMVSANAAHDDIDDIGWASSTAPMARIG